MRYLLALAVLLFTSIHTQTVAAQSANANKARAYYFQAEAKYASKEYSEALSLLKKAESMLGKSNARLTALEVKILYGDKKYLAAEKALNRFYNFSNAGENLQREMAGYLSKIEARASAERKRIAAIGPEQGAKLAERYVKRFAGTINNYVNKLKFTRDIRTARVTKKFDEQNKKTTSNFWVDSHKLKFNQFQCDFKDGIEGEEPVYVKLAGKLTLESQNRNLPSSHVDYKAFNFKTSRFTYTFIFGGKFTFKSDRIIWYPKETEINGDKGAFPREVTSNYNLYPVRASSKALEEQTAKAVVRAFYSKYTADEVIAYKKNPSAFKKRFNQYMRTNAFKGCTAAKNRKAQKAREKRERDREYAEAERKLREEERARAEQGRRFQEYRRKNIGLFDECFNDKSCQTVADQIIRNKDDRSKKHRMDYLYEIMTFKCDNVNISTACYVAAVEFNLRNRLNYFMKACDKGHGEACLNAAAGYFKPNTYFRWPLKGKSVGKGWPAFVSLKQSIEQSVALFEKGCLLGSLTACQHWYRVYSLKDTGRTSKRQKKKTLKAICKQIPNFTFPDNQQSKEWGSATKKELKKAGCNV